MPSVEPSTVSVTGFDRNAATDGSFGSPLTPTFTFTAIFCGPVADVLVLIEFRIASGLPLPEAVVATVPAVDESSFLLPPHPLATSASASVAPIMGFQTFILDRAFLPFPWDISLHPGYG